MCLFLKDYFLNDAHVRVKEKAMNPVKNPVIYGAIISHSGCAKFRSRRESRRPAQASTGIALVHLISSRQTLECTPLTPGMRISVSSRNVDRPFRSCATTFST